jgi:hypothetical protein
MAVLSRDAQAILDRYLDRLRGSLRGHASIDVEDVERDVQSHIESALAGEPEPIDARSIRQVLDGLGAPEQWVSADDLPTWRQALSRPEFGAADWRLPYVAFFCFLAGPLLFFVPTDSDAHAARGPFLWPLSPVLMITAFVLARASLSVLTAKGEPIETRQWLLYPPLLFVYVPAAIALLGWPVPLMLAAIGDFVAVRAWTATLIPRSMGMSTAAISAFALGTWWIVLGGLTHRFRGIVQAAFWPFANTLQRRQATVLVVAGGAIVTTAAVALGMFRN